MMNAAVVHAIGQAPRYEAFALPVATDEDEVVGDMLAVALHPRVRSSAAGTHYTSAQQLPLIPGVDGVACLPDGRRVYFVASDSPLGTMAEKAVIDRRQAITLPDNADAVSVAGAMIPAMSAWLALRKRISFEAGKQVLILGATGNAGRMAIQIAKHLGAGRVIAAGRDATMFEQLRALGADTVVSLAGDPAAAAAQVGEAAAEVDAVIDYLWGQPAEHIMRALVMHRAERSRALDWIHIGSMAGLTLTLPSELLRAANLRILGSGQGAIGTREIVAELPSLMKELAAGTLKVNTQAVPLAQVESAWDAPMARGVCVVFTP